MSDDVRLKADLGDWFTARWNETFGAEVGRVLVASLVKLSAGQSSDLVDVTCQRGDRTESYIIRVEPRARQLFLKPDVLREGQVLRGLEHSEAPAPKVWWMEKDEALFGAPFIVMGKVDGRPVLGRPSFHLKSFLVDLNPAERRALWMSAMDGLVKVHRTDWRKSHAFLAPEDMSRGYLGAYIHMVGEWYEWTAKGRDYPLMEAALEYLRDGVKMVDDSDPVLVWNDARMGNMLFGPDNRLAAVIDWEMPLIAPAGIDLGYWLMMDEFHGRGIGVTPLEGLPDEAETIRIYEQMSGRKVTDVDYFVVLAAFFINTTLIRQADIYVGRGELEPDTRMGIDNTSTQMIARRIGLPIPPMSPDFAFHRQLPVPAA